MSEVAEVKKTDETTRVMWILGLICAITGIFVLPIIFSSAGIVLGGIAVGKKENKGWWGLGIGFIGLVGWALLMLAEM